MHFVRNYQTLSQTVAPAVGVSRATTKTPQAFRHGHAVFALQHTQRMTDYKAVSMNLLHGNIQIADGTYAPPARSEIKQRVSGLLEQFMPPLSDQNVHPNFADNLTDSQLAAGLTAAATRLSW